MKVFRPNNTKTGFTLVEIMIVVLIIGILLAIAIPNFVAAREASRAKACIGNLKQIDSATQQYAMDKQINAGNYAANKPTLDSGNATSLIGATAYIRTAPTCPAGGSELVAPTLPDTPYCTISGSKTNATPLAGTNTDSNYAPATPAAGAAAAAPAGKFYHGM